MTHSKMRERSGKSNESKKSNNNEKGGDNYSMHQILTSPNSDDQFSVYTLLNMGLVDFSDVLVSGNFIILIYYKVWSCNKSLVYI